MANVLLVAYLLIVLALIVTILLQRSEGGALGIGGGGGGGFMTARGSANLLTRTTSILAVLFFATAIGLTILSELDRGTSSILDSATEGEEGEDPTSVLDALNSLGGGSSDLPVPETDATTDTTPVDALDLAVPDAPAAGTTTEAPAATAPAETAPVEPAPADDATTPVEQPAPETDPAPAPSADPVEAPATDPAPAEPTPAAPTGN